jgi:hypothetical protein
MVKTIFRNSQGHLSQDFKPTQIDKSFERTLGLTSKSRVSLTGKSLSQLSLAY